MDKCPKCGSNITTSVNAHTRACLLCNKVYELSEFDNEMFRGYTQVLRKEIDEACQKVQVLTKE